MYTPKSVPGVLRKKEMIYHVKFETRDETRRKTFEFIEVFYSRRRMHSYPDYMSPVEFETAAANAA